MTDDEEAHALIEAMKLHDRVCVHLGLGTLRDSSAGPVQRRTMLLLDSALRTVPAYLRSDLDDLLQVTESARADYVTIASESGLAPSDEETLLTAAIAPSSSQAREGALLGLLLQGAISTSAEKPERDACLLAVCALVWLEERCLLTSLEPRKLVGRGVLQLLRQHPAPWAAEHRALIDAVLAGCDESTLLKYLARTALWSFTSDFSQCRWRGQRFEFTGTQAAICKVLYEAWRSDEGPCHADDILKRSNQLTNAKSSQWMSDAFRGRGPNGRHPAWGTLIGKASAGRYQLRFE